MCLNIPITVTDTRSLYVKLNEQILRRFREGMDAAVEAGIPETTAMTLATCQAGQPSARTVLLKHVDPDGFVFYTNLESNKGRQLAENPRVALVFWWRETEQQVKVEGRAEPVSAVEADEYFASRPRGSRIGAWASDQSRPLESREALRARVQELEEEYRDREIPRPAHWSGFRVRPDMVEFWYGREYRLHERIRFRAGEQGWTSQLLFP